MATLTVQTINHAGLTPSFTAAAGGGDEFVNTGNCFLYVKNGDTASMDVTVANVKLSNYGKDDDVVVSVPASSEEMIGSFPKWRFDDSNQKVQITYSAVTSVTVAAIKLDPDGL